MDVDDRIDDVNAVADATIQFAIDPEDEMWFVGQAGETRVWMKMNSDFPDSSAYSVWLGDDRWWHVDDLPATWTMPSGPYEWPDTARPAPKTSFWD